MFAAKPEPREIVVLVLCGLCFSPATMGSVVIKTGLAEDHAEHKNSDVFGISSKLGTTDFQQAQGHNIEGEKKFSHVEDAGKYNEAAGEKKLLTDTGKFSDENFYKQNGGSLVDTGKSTSYKKGHHKSGFHKSYNKDESGSESSFFDDGSDEGGHVYKNSYNGQYGDQGANEKHGSHLDDRRYENEKANQGAYNKGDVYEKDFDDRKLYDTKKYYDGHEKVGKSGAADVHGLKGNKGYYEEKYLPKPPIIYHEKPHIHKEYINPLPAEKTITIYEDPRVYEKGYVHDRPYDGPSNVRLDIRPPPVVQYPDPVYDYYY